MPTPLERQGDFSQTLDTNGRLIFIRDPQRAGACSPTPAGRRVSPATSSRPIDRQAVRRCPISSRTPNFTDRTVSLGQNNYRDQDICDVTDASISSGSTRRHGLSIA